MTHTDEVWLGPLGRGEGRHGSTREIKPPPASAWGGFALEHPMTFLEDWPTPEAMAAAQRLYERSSAPVPDIAILRGLQERHIYWNTREGGWPHRRGGGRPPPMVTGRAREAPPGIPAADNEERAIS